MRKSPEARFIMRATPYCSVSPRATLAYMPPRMSPKRMTSLVIMGECALSSPVPSACSFPLLRRLPRRLRRDWLDGARQGRRSKAAEFAALPLPGPPGAGVDVLVELDRADDGIEGAGLD